MAKGCNGGWGGQYSMANGRTGNRRSRPAMANGENGAGNWGRFPQLSVQQLLLANSAHNRSYATREANLVQVNSLVLALTFPLPNRPEAASVARQSAKGPRSPKRQRCLPPPPTRVRYSQ